VFGGGTADATATGSRLAFLRWSAKPVVIEIQTTDANGGTPETLVGGGLNAAPPTPFPLSSLSWSGDGSLIAFTGQPGGVTQSLRADKPEIFVAPVDGGDPRAVPGTAGGQFPVLAPDGRSWRSSGYVDPTPRRALQVGSTGGPTRGPQSG
jgi:Tol biopolymer transport system component